MNERALWLIVALVGVALVAPFAYFMAYSPLKIKGKGRRGRQLSRDIQQGYISCAILLIAFYFGFPALYPGDEYVRGAFAIVLGTGLVGNSAFFYFCGKLVDEPGWLYYRSFVAATSFGGMGLFYSGLFWMMYNPRPIRLEAFSFALAMTVLLAGELIYLQRNNWKFVVDDPQ